MASSRGFPMHDTRTTTMLITAILTLGLSAPVAALAEDPEAIARRLAGRKIEVTNVRAEGTSVRWGRAVAVVDAPYEAVVAAVEDYGNYKKFVPRFQASRVLSQRGSSALVYMQAGILKGTIKVWAQVKLRARTLADKTHVVEGKMLKGNLEQMGARWEIRRLSGGRTLVAFQMLMDPDLPVPSSLVTDQNEEWTRKTLRALRKLVEKKAGTTAARALFGAPPARPGSLDSHSTRC